MGDLSSSAAATRAPAPSSVSPAAQTSTQGLIAGTAAFVIWGFFPLYLFGLRSVSALEITAHRVVWSCVFILIWMAARHELGQISCAATRPGVLPRLIASAALITINWLAFVWAINNSKVVEVSLGYYINPLINVVLGIVVLSERLNRFQWIAIGLATAGVAYLSIQTGQIPLIALAVAISFALYGLIRKTASVDALPGLAIETILLAPLAVGFLLWSEANGTGAFGHRAGWIAPLLIGGGLITAIPLFLFAYGARKVPYSTLGVLQYVAPTLQLACAVLVFKEPFDHGRVVGFALIWIALAVYAVDGIVRTRRQRA